MTATVLRVYGGSQADSAVNVSTGKFAVNTTLALFDASASGNRVDNNGSIVNADGSTLTGGISSNGDGILSRFGDTVDRDLWAVSIDGDGNELADRVILIPSDVRSALSGLKTTAAGAALKVNNGSDFADAGSTRANLHVSALTAAQCVATSTQALTGQPIIDGYQTTNSDVVLLTAQATASQNGQWQLPASGSGAWARPTDFAAGLVVKGRTSLVVGGTTYGGSHWSLNASASVTVDTTAQVWKLTNKAITDAAYVPSLGILAPLLCGVKADVRMFNDVTFTAGSPTLTSAGKQFVASDVGKAVSVSQGLGTVQTATVQATVASNVASIPLTAAVTPGIYLIGTELLHISSVTGSSSPFTANLGQSNTLERSLSGHSSGETVTRLDVLTTTIQAVAGDGSTATMATNATATSSSEFPPPATPGAAVSSFVSTKAIWIGTDDTTAWRALAADVPTTGATVLFMGRSLITGTVEFTHRVKFLGGGGLSDSIMGGTSQIWATSLTTDAILLDASGSSLDGLGVLHTSIWSSPPTAGVGVHHTHATNSVHSASTAVVGFFNNVQVDEGDYYSLTGQYLDGFNYGIYTLTPSGEEQDHGDQTFAGATIAMMWSTYRPGGSAVRWESGGGLRLPNIKINGLEQTVNYKAGQYTYGIDMAIADYATTVDLFVGSASSIEACKGCPIYVHTKGPNNTGTFGNILINGAELGYGGSVNIVGGAPGGVASVVYVGNQMPSGAGIYLKNVAGTVIGPNDWGLNTASVVNVDTGCTDVNVDFGQQTVRGDNLALWGDNTVTSTSHGPFGNTRFHVAREIPTTTSTSTYTTLYHFTPPQNQAGVMEVTLEGYAVGVGPVLINAKRSMTKGTGACTLTTIGTDTQSDSGATIDFLFDTATTSGDVYVKVRLHSGGTATDFAGRCYMKYDGPLFTLRKGS